VTDGPEHKHEGEGHLIRTLTAASILIALIGAAVSLLFHLAPNLEPCVGGASAAFTGAPVFPRVRFRDYLIRDGAAREDAAAQPNLYGAEVRFSYRADNLRGAQLPLVWSLVTIGKGGVVNAVVPGQDRALAMTVTPDRCGDTGGKDSSSRSAIRTGAIASCSSCTETSCAPTASRSSKRRRSRAETQHARAFVALVTFR
jgi:hypothetical protein